MQRGTALASTRVLRVRTGRGDLKGTHVTVDNDLREVYILLSEWKGLRVE